MSQFAVDEKRCKRDGVCVAECPPQIIEIKKAGDFPSLIDGGQELCINCGHCVAVCPHDAASLSTMGPKDCPRRKARKLPTPDEVELLLRSRRSVRVYLDKPVEKGLLAKLIDIARYAPSGHNAQPVHWLVLSDGEELKLLAGIVIDWMRSLIQKAPQIANSMHMDRIVDSWEHGEDRILRRAPHLIIAHAEKAVGPAAAACNIALTYLELAAYSMGLGACWAGYFNAAAGSYPPMIEALKLPQGHQCFGAMMVGYPKYEFRRIPLRNSPSVAWR
jgi:nitroreductase/NAD-dependent dihydropyrimidine dehydrogenase PreA subunit